MTLRFPYPLAQNSYLSMHPLLTFRAKPQQRQRPRSMSLAMLLMLYEAPRVEFELLPVLLILPWLLVNLNNRRVEVAH